MSRKRLLAEFALKLLAEHAESGAAVEDVDAVAEAHFDAGGITSIAHVLGLWGGRRTAHAPELNPHRLLLHHIPAARYGLVYLRTKGSIRQLPEWFKTYFTAIFMALLQGYSIMGFHHCSLPCFAPIDAHILETFARSLRKVFPALANI